MKRRKSIKKFYNPNEKYLFLGNGINLLKKGDSWGDLLTKITEKAGIDIDFEDKTYPLLFEEIAFKIKMNGYVEDNIWFLKNLIGEVCSQYQPNEIHHKLINLNYYHHFITTNYDYNIENSITFPYDSIEGKNKKNSKYSLDRFNQINGIKVWHIHGEIDNGLRGEVIKKEASILIGNEHYGDYQRKIHELIKGTRGEKLYKLMKNADENWVHLFFCRDIDIIGFGLNFSEYHLWFLLNVRARMIRRDFAINNIITWYIPSFQLEMDKPKIDLLSTLKVEVVPIKAKKQNYKMFYENFIKSKS